MKNAISHEGLLIAIIEEVSVCTCQNVISKESVFFLHLES